MQGLDGDSPRFADAEARPPSANPLSASTQHGPPPPYESLMLTREVRARPSIIFLTAAACGRGPSGSGSVVPIAGVPFPALASQPRGHS